MTSSFISSSIQHFYPSMILTNVLHASLRNSTLLFLMCPKLAMCFNKISSVDLYRVTYWPFLQWYFAHSDAL